MDVQRNATFSSRMIFAFRTDASLQIGTGHVMRCLTLADSLIAKGAECHFICREHAGNLIEYVRGKGYATHSLPILDVADTKLAHSHWLGSTQAQDAEACAPILAKLQPDWLVVDHYALDAKWEALLAPHYRNLMVIDDLADRAHECDLLLDQNFGRAVDDYRAWVPSDCTLLCGSSYALLRPEFAELREYSLQRRTTHQLKNLFINMGGVDKDNVTSKVLASLHSAPLPSNCEITVIMGTTSPWLDEVKKLAATMPWNTTVQAGVSNMAQLMADSDLAIGAAGATSWERCCLGLASLVMVLAENQRAGAVAMQNAGVATFIPDSNQIAEVLSSFLSSTELNSPLPETSRACAKVCDGTGVARVLAYLLPVNLKARLATQLDEMLLYSWANDKLTRLNSFNPAPIPLSEHKIWLASRLATANLCSIFVVERSGAPIGLVRFDKTDEEQWVIDYSVAPTCRGQGLGSRVLSCGLAAFGASQDDAVVVAKVKSDNVASCRVVESLDFKLIEQSRDVKVYSKAIFRTPR